MRKKLNKKTLNNLRLEHNRVVKKEYRVNPANQKLFDEWFINNCSYPEDLGTTCEGVPFFLISDSGTYAEIPRHQTKSGNPYILEVS
tara:strand:+ start:625 stop:885 length:261 start_codon:yes stop_codon:yes gene_type:complete